MTQIDKVIRGDGFIAYHLRIAVDSAYFIEVCEHLRALKEPLRKHGVAPPFPQTFEQSLCKLPGVREVISEGAYASIIIPLRLIHACTGRPVLLSGCIGTGPVSHYVSAQLSTVGLMLELEPREGDTPLEISIVGGKDQRRTVRLYMPRQFHHTLRLVEPQIAATAAFLVSKHNAGRVALAARLHACGCYTGLRIGAMNRYVMPAHYREALRHFHHVVLSTAEDSMKQMARALNISLPTSPEEPQAQLLADALGRYHSGRRLVVLFFQALGSAMFFVPGQKPVVVRAPAHFDTASRTARLHGACAALALNQSSPVALEDFLPNTQETLAAFAEWAIQAAYYGTDRRPTVYPGSSFQPEGCWQS